ncbi:MAG: hypothetical protein AAF587_04860 [Bacteroidota bacterium]
MMKKYKFIGLFFATFACHCTSLTQDPAYYDPPPLATHFNGEHFVGSESCIECHAEIYASHLQSAHYRTSQPPSEENIKGSFEPGSNRLELENVAFEMTHQEGTFYQHTIIEDMTQPIPPQTFDIVIGSGIKGQSYLSWDNDYLFQLQVSYYPPTNSWINSPGFPSTPIKRPVRDGCLKCHVSFATNRDFSGQGNQYDKEKIVYRVDCERCHNPAMTHVTHHRSHPDIDSPTFILTFDTLSRQQRLDACAQCHSGPRAGIIKGNSFSYLVGETLADYSRNFHTGQKDHELDVHGNQYGLLRSSTCFQQSPQMDCMTCHDPHSNQRGDIAHFNHRCIECHGAHAISCTADASDKQSMKNSCIACHMPNTPSKSMSVQLDQDSLETPVYIRTHLIDIYPKESWHH